MNLDKHFYHIQLEIDSKRTIFISLSLNICQMKYTYSNYYWSNENRYSVPWLHLEEGTFTLILFIVRSVLCNSIYIVNTIKITFLI